MRLFFITLFSFIVLGTLILMARIWGLGQSHPTYHSDFFNGATPFVISKVSNIDKINDQLSLKKDLIFWLDVRISKDNVLYVLPPSEDKAFIDHLIEKQKANPQTPIMVGGKLSNYDWQALSEFFPKATKLVEFYEKFPEQRFFLNIVDNSHDVHNILATSLEPFRSNKRTFVQSDALIIMTTLKDVKPEWSYGTSVPDLMRLMTMDSLWVLPSTQFKGDVFVAPFIYRNRPAFNASIIEEIRRRNKKVFLGPITTREELNLARTYNADAYITENLEELLLMLNQGPAQ